MKMGSWHITRLAGTVSIIAGLLAVTGLVFRIPALQNIVPGLPAIRFNAALCFILVGNLLLLASGKPGMRRGGLFIALSVILLLIATITLSQNIFNYNAGIDELLFRDRSGLGTSKAFPGQMSPATSLSFLFLGVSFLLTISTSKFLQQGAQLLFHLISVLAFLAVTGYLYEVPAFYNLSLVNPMPVHTAVLLLFVSIAATFIHRQWGITGLLGGRGIGNIMARELFPATIGVVLVLGYGRLVAHRQGWLSVNFGIALFVVSFIFVLLFLVGYTAYRLNKIDLKREHTEAKFLGIEQQLRRTMDNMLEGAQLVGFDWKYKYVNDALVKHAKYSREELLGHTVMEKFPGIENTEIYKVYQRCFRERIPIHLENEFTFPDGSIGWFELSFQPVPEGVFILSVDITERKKAEQALLQSKRDLEKRACELEISNAELERFAYVASHDLQEPLRMVSSFLHLLEKKMEGQLDESTKQYIEFAVDGADRMKKLIQDLLLYSRVSTNKETLTWVDCNQVMEEVRQTLKPSIDETNATVNVRELPVIKAIRPQVIQLFQNLVGNALKYHGEEPPLIEVGCQGKNGLLEFYIRDNGIGINPRFFDKIFVIFQRLHNKTRYSGTGIGLSICKKIVERHGGSINVQSVPGKGTTFYFTLPQS
jgi:PAS domain S-box-containing protein